MNESSDSDSKKRPLFAKIDELKESIEKLSDIVTHSNGGIVEFSEKSAEKLPRGRLVPRNIDGFRKLVNTLNPRSKIIDIGSCVGRTIMSVSDIILDKELKLYCLDSWDNEDYIKSWNMKPKDIFQQFVWNIQLIKEQINVLNFNPVKSIELFDNESVDMIIVDKLYNKNIYKKTLHTFYNKLKPGGIFFMFVQKDKSMDDFLTEVKAVPIVLDESKDLEDFKNIPMDIIAFYK
jgi:hypothetical protein